MRILKNYEVYTGRLSFIAILLVVAATCNIKTSGPTGYSTGPSFWTALHVPCLVGLQNNIKLF